MKTFLFSNRYLNTLSLILSLYHPVGRPQVTSEHGFLKCGQNWVQTYNRPARRILFVRGTGSSALSLAHTLTGDACQKTTRNRSLKPNSATNCNNSCVMKLLCWWFTALRHLSGHFGRGQLTYLHWSWASLLGSLPVLSAHSFANNWQLPFLNQRKGETGRRNYFMTNLYERMFPDVSIEPATVHIPGGRGSDRATAPGV